MFNFKSFISEETENVKPTKLGHLTHLHRMLFNFPKGEAQNDAERTTGGHSGAATSEKLLNHLHDYLRGAKTPSSFSVGEKMEGAPSFLIRNQGGVTSVGYKGAAGKEDRLASTHEDIDRLYGHAPGLADKLHRIMDHGGKILPDSPTVYQGDYMGDGGSEFTQPNTVGYHFGKDTPEGIKAKRAKVLLSLHTKYGKYGAEPIDNKTRATFLDHPDVHHMDPTVRVNPANYTPEEQSQYAMHMASARKEYSKMKPEAEDFFRRHGDNIESYINRTIREGSAPSVQGFVSHLTDKSNKKLESLKSEKGRTTEANRHSQAVGDVMDNQHHLTSGLNFAQHLQNAQEVLRKVAAKNTPHATSINGVASEGEGLVASFKNKDGTTTSAKIANPDFTSTNLRGGGNISKAQKISEETEEAPVTRSVWYGRGQGWHGGHVAGAMSAINDGNQHGGGHNIILTHTHDKNNPLTPEQKTYYATKGLPQGAKVSTTSPEAPSLLQQAALLHKQGVTRLRLFAGSDRVNQYQDLMNRYNGVFNDKGEGYHFKHGIEVIPVGDERTQGDADSMASYSGSALRKAAAADDKDSFDKMASPHLSPEDKDQMRNDIKAGLQKFAKKPKVVKEEAYVPNEGNAATVADLSARGAPQESGPLKKKKLKENTTGSVGGLGFNTGNPAAGETSVQQYQDTNGTLAKDDENGNLIKNHNNLHAPLGFKAFDPSKDLTKGKK
jgi:hypothetical protein